MRRTSVAPPIASAPPGVLEAGHGRVFFQNAVNDSFERAGSLAMDDPEVKNSPAAAFLQIFRDQVFHFSRPKGMKVQDAVDGDFDRVRILRFFYGLAPG